MVSLKKYEAKIAIFELLDRYLELRPERGVEMAKGFAQLLATTLTLQELNIWRCRAQEDVTKAENAD